MEVGAGPGKTLKWGVPAGRRDAETGEPVQDDLLISAALCAVLDEKMWGRAEAEPYMPTGSTGVGISKISRYGTEPMA